VPVSVAAASALSMFDGDASLSGGLKKGLAKIMAAHAAEWRESALATLVSPPKLVDFDWRVDTKTSSNHLSRMAVPTVFVEMRVRND
jgi:hypothetical protein